MIYILINLYHKMGTAEVHERNTDGEQMNCTYCNKHLDTYFDFFPHEAGGYCIFAPRSEIDHACKECAFKICECCGKEQVRFAFIECKPCNKTHCFNNTDMKYEGNPFLENIILCDARHCKKNESRDETESKSDEGEIVNQSDGNSDNETENNETNIEYNISI